MKRIWIFAAVLLIAGCAEKAEAPVAIEAATPGLQAEAGGAEGSEAVCSNYTIAVRRNAQAVSERALTAEEEIRAAEEIVFDYLTKSAAWEGIEASELEDCITLSFDSTGEAERQTYYQFDTEGRHVLQAGETGWYSIMSDGAYEKLLRLAGLSEQTGLTVDEAGEKLQALFGERDAETGNTFFFGYAETITLEGKDYYLFRISWLVDNDHLSYLTDYLVAADGSEMREYAPES